MKRKSIKWRIFKYNLFVIIILITFVAIIFNIAVRTYFENDVLGQLGKIASQTEDTALRQGPNFFPDSQGPPKNDGKGHPPAPDDAQGSSDLYRYYFMLDRSLREPLSVLNADYILLDSDKNLITPSPVGYFNSPSGLVDIIKGQLDKSSYLESKPYSYFTLSGTEYVAIIKPVSQKNTFGLGWIVIYSSLQKIYQLQLVINIILFSILIVSALIIVIFSSRAAKKISAPFSSLNEHIGAIAERNFGTKIQMKVDDELQEFVENINVMSEKLETYDKAQKTFLQNVSHEFRTPLMSIQSYAEGIKYEVVDKDTAAGIITDESKRLAHLVDDLLYLSRLDTIEENYHYSDLDTNDLVNSCVERMNGIAIKSNIKIVVNKLDYDIKIYGDEEKLSRAITNVISNCIRYAESRVIITVKKLDNDSLGLDIFDDGPGFESNDLPNLFQRFYKGKKGNFGLGLSISKNVIEKHNGTINAENTDHGALFKIVLPVGKHG